MNGSRRRVGSFHYGWVVVAAGTMTVFASLGLGRFALGMLLPSMGLGLSLTYTEMGVISTGNFIGYLAAVAMAGRVERAFGARRAIAWSLFVVAASMMLVSRASGFYEILAYYVVTGLGSGISNVLIMGLVSHWFLRSRRGRAAGFMVSGSGFAIVFSGFLVPAVNAGWGADGWRVSWMVLAGAALAVAALTFVLLRNKPEDMGVAPLGTEPPRRAGIETAESGLVRLIAHFGAIYFLFGFTYVIYATFIVTTLVQERGFPESTAGHFWALIGFLSIFSGPLFGTLSDRLGRKEGLMIVFSLQMASYLLVAADLPDIFLYLSIGLFGVCAWSIPGIMAAAMGDYMGAHKAAAAFGTITFVFGIGQIAGPAAAGWLADQTGSFTGGFFLAAALAAGAIVLSRFLRRPHE